MKCPKCGSEISILSVTPKQHITVCINKQCEKFGYGFSLEELKQMKHQARLDKVLSKMCKTSSDEMVYRKKERINDYWFNYSMEMQTFHFGITSQIISLETVESLLKDLEEE